MRRTGFLALAGLLIAMPLAADTGSEPDKALEHFEKRTRLGVEHDGLYMEEPRNYSYDFAMLRVAEPERFATLFTGCDWYRINQLYRAALKAGKWEIALWHAYYISIIAPERSGELNLHDSDWQGMKGVFIRNYRQYPEYSLAVAARLQRLFPERMRELHGELGELRDIVVRNGLGWDLWCFKNRDVAKATGSCMYSNDPAIRESARRAYWLSFIDSYAYFKAVFGEDVGPELNDADWQRISQRVAKRAKSYPDHYAVDLRADVLIARDGLDTVLARTSLFVPDSPESARKACKPRVVAGLRPEFSWSIGTNFSGPSSGGFYVGNKIMLFRLSKNWRAGGFGLGLAKFASSGEYTDDGYVSHRNSSYGFGFTVIPLKWKRVALEIKPYKYKVLHFHPQGKPTKGVVFSLTLAFGTESGQQ